jgi:hypothetical protein
MVDVNLNVNPYYDDYDETKDFQKILFKPSFAVQARELTQLQTILEKQISRHGDHIFQEGSVVDGLNRSLTLTLDYVRIKDLDLNSNNVDVSVFKGKTVKGLTTGCEALVVNVGDGTEGTNITAKTGPKTLFLQYDKTGTDKSTRFFAAGETIVVVADDTIKCIAFSDEGYRGYGSQVQIDSGIVYAKSKFLFVQKQVTILDRYSFFPTVKVGYDITNNFIGIDSDTTLLDPAQGSPNFNAPGADRLQYKLTLNTREVDSSDLDDFVELFTVQDGKIPKSASEPQYAELRKEFARRTFDESGNYTVNPFNIRIRDHLNDGSNGGRYLKANGGNKDLLAIGIEPGIAYVQGFKYESVITEYLNIRKGLDTEEIENQTITAAYGNYVIVNEIVGSFPFDTLGTVSLRDTAAKSVTNTTFGATATPGVEIGRARVRSVVYDSGTPGTADCKYRMYLFDINMTSTKEFADVKCITNISTVADKYLADPFLTEIQGINSNILFFDDDQVLSEDSSFKIVFEDSIDANKNKLKETGQFNKLIYKLPENNIKRIRDSNGEVETSYKFRKEFEIIFAENGTATLSTGLTEETFPFAAGPLSETNRRVNFIVIPLESVGPFQIGLPIDFSAAGTGGTRSINIVNANAASFNVQETLTGSMRAKVVTSLTKANAKESRKILVKTGAVTINPQTHPATTNGPWTLGKSDCFKIKSVHMSGGFGSLPNTNDLEVTDNFILDTGQRDNFYDHGLIKKSPISSLSITGQLLVSFEYFTHDTSQGIGYFSVDSYPIDDEGLVVNTIKTFEIPVYTSSVGRRFDLRDSIDCRPRRNDSSITVNPPISSNSDFTIPSGGAHMMAPNESISFDLEFYLPRKDKISINKEGNFSIIEGISRNPIAFTPQDNADSMTVALIDIPAFPSLVSSIAKKSFNRPFVKLKVVNNQRYTMKDIGQLEERLNRVEYYTALSLLEKDTSDLQITDQGGNNRFKNGILVDPFTGHNIGDIINPDYKASIDMKKQELRPKFTLENIPFVLDETVSSGVTIKSKNIILTFSNVQGTFQEKEVLVGGTSNAQCKIINDVLTASNKVYCDELTGTFVVSELIKGATSGATATISFIKLATSGDLVTLPYNQIVFAENPFATKERNCVSELQFHWVGQLELTPNTDNWVDTENAPDVQVNFDNNMDAWETLADAWQTHWNDWETVATGEEIINRERVGGRIRLEGARGQNVFQEQNERVTTLITQQQTRTGVQLNIQPEALTHKLGSKLVDVSVIPFIREKELSFTATRLKPNTQIFAFFDNEDVSSFCTPAGGNQGDNLVTDNVGSITGTFLIPNTEALRFRVGDRKFRLADAYTRTGSAVSTEFSANVKTSAETIYSARGLLQTAEETIISTSKANVQTVTVTDSRVDEETQTTINNTGERFVGEVANQQIINITNITNNTTNVTQQATQGAPAVQGGQDIRTGGIPFTVAGGCTVSSEGERLNRIQDNAGCENGNWLDPIAQTFFIDQPGGLFLSKLDVYFRTKSTSLPITLQVREVVNGFPGQKIIPGGEVILFPADINLSTDATAATPFYFKNPVYLSHGVEYCFALLPAGNNPDYEVFVSELGQNKIGTTERVSEQPYVGILFTSANNRTWTARQEEDIKFSLYKADFEVNTAGTASFTNKNIDYCNINNLTGNGNFKVGEVITTSGSSATGIVVAYSKAKLRLEIQNVSGRFQTTETLTGAKSGVTATLLSFTDFKVNVIHPQAEQLVFHATSLSWSLKTTNNSNVLGTNFKFISINSNNTLLDEKRVLSYSNEIDNLADKRSVNIQSVFTSGYSSISPVIDMRRLSAICIENLINNDSTNEDNPTGGNALAKYISKRVVLDEDLDAEDVKVFITADKPSGTQIEIYYKIINNSDETELDDRPYIKMDQVTDSGLFSIDIQELDDFKEFEYKVPTAQLSGNNGEIQYTGTQASNPVFTGFKVMAIKIVMLSSNTALVPRLKDLRAIALSV